MPSEPLERSKLSDQTEFEGLWVLMEGGDTRGWFSGTVSAAVERIESMKQVRLKIIHADLPPYEGDMKMIVFDQGDRAQAVLRMKESEEDSCLWRLRCMEKVLSEEIRGNFNRLATAMNVLKHPSLFRPSGQPSSIPLNNPTPPTSRPNSANGFERAARPLNKLTLSTFRRSSPSPNLNNIPTTLVQDGSYLELLNLKLSEAVSKALAQPTGPAAAFELLAGKRPIPVGRGHALGDLIASELKATQDSPHLYRAIIRSLHRPLSVLLTNLSAHLIPLISSSAFQLPPSVHSPNPNPTQLHAIATATFVGELLETFDQYDLGTDVDVRGDGLKPIREGLVSLINRVVGPMMNIIRNELMPLLEALEIPNSAHGPKPVPGAKSLSPHHPSVVALQTTMPVYAKVIARLTTSASSQATLATFLISVVWRALVALSHRPYVPATPPTSPGLAPVGLKKNRGSTTPPMTPPASRFNIKLPPSRPPSPPTLIIPATAAADARALFDLLNLLPRPEGNRESTRLAREVVDDAFDGLQALPALLDAVHAVPAKIDSHDRLDQVARDLELLATNVPLLIALPVVLQAPANGSGIVSVSSLLGFGDAQYRKECMSGFGRAEQCAITVAHRVLESLRSNTDVHSVVYRWLDMEVIEALEQAA
ncbi:hypothetical protein H0H93_007934 [Arthromyces matolae]|nr:hypothetical protein H0H93_007934 [Arthromyces matolae]